MKTFGRVSFTILALLFIMSSAIVAVADDDDPPSRVARLKYISGDVSVQPGGVDDWVAANVNRPLTTSDRVWTDKDARAELHLGTSVMRMDSETSVTLTNIADETVQVALYQGALILRVKYLLRGEIYEVDTPNIAFTITKAGEYRFDVDSNRDITFVTVRKGEGVATADGPAVKVKKNQSARFSDAKSLAHVVSAAPGRDGFDQWSKIRDDRESYYVASRRYVSPYMIGYEDLDDHGYWRYVPGYGYLWFPRYTVADWAPYRYGHWVWISPWGWTWVDDAPWGFAPFHYGRWVYSSGYWGWCPGPRYYRPYYAPALVAWVGGRNWGFGISFGSGVGWFPLGFGDPYIPYYRVSRNYFQQVNISNTRITNVTNITNMYNNVYNTNNVRNTNINIDNSHNNPHDNIHNNVHIRYANYTVPGAMTGVPRDAMERGRPVDKVRVKIDPRNLDERDVQFRPQATPSRDSVLGANAERPAARPARDIAMRPVKEKLTPPSQRAPFDRERQAVEREQGRGGNHEIMDPNSGARGMDRGNIDRNPVAGNGRGNDRRADDRERVNAGGSSRGEEQSAGKVRDGNGGHWVPRPPKAGEQNDQGSSNSDSGRGNRPRMDRSPADNSTTDMRGRQPETRGANGAPDISDRVPRPPQRGRGSEATRPIEAENLGDREVPRPEMGNAENNGGGIRRDRSTPNASSDSGRQRDRSNDHISVPRPPAERGSGMESPRTTPSERSSGMGSGGVDRGPSMESPRIEQRSTPPASVRADPAPRPESYAPHLESPQARPEQSAPRQMEAPRGGGGGGQAPAAPQGRAPEKNQGGKSNSDRKSSGKDKN